jgi:predicted ATPase/DNA-binding SARP family transcriptional activator
LTSGSPTPIEFLTLGTIELRQGDRSDLDAVLKQHKRLALLTYLSLSPGFKRRDLLIALLWPDLDHLHARTALRQAIYFLRHQLSEELFDVRGQEEIGIREDELWCDSVALHRAFQAKDVASVAELYGGELLPGFHVSHVASEFEHWIENERFRINDEAQRAFSQLSKKAEKRGALGDASRWARKAVELSPTDECSARRLISILDRMGDRAGAVHVYDSLVQRLDELLDVEPSDDTHRLIHDIRGRVAQAPTSLTEEPEDPEHSIPSPPTRLIGRQQEIEHIMKLLARDHVRLVTVTGTGGIGKSRLAIEVARHMVRRSAIDTWLVPLRSGLTPEQLPATVATALEVRGKPGKTHRQQVIDHLTGRDALLVLDGFEHVTGAGSWIRALIESLPRLKVLVTSRVTLRIRGEHEFKTCPLTLPNPKRLLGTELPLDSEAVALFVDRATAADQSFRLTKENVRPVAEICRHLDGLPLAIELAAMRIKSLSPRELLENLAKPFEVLSRGPTDAPVRHQTLQATIRWSCDLLSPLERELFYGLSTFVDGCDLKAIKAVWPHEAELSVLDGIAALVEANLVQRSESPGGTSRYGMLETLHEYATDELAESARHEDWRRRHAHHYAELVESGERNYCTECEPQWLDHLEEESANLQAALEWSVSSGDAEMAGRFVGSLWWFWWTRGDVAVGREWADRVLSMAGLSKQLRAKALVGTGSLALSQADHDGAVAALEESVTLQQEVGDECGIVNALQNLGFAQRERGDLGAARISFERVLELSREMDDESRMGGALFSLGSLAHLQKEYREATRLLEEGILLSRRAGNRGRVARGLVELGEIAHKSGDLRGAKGYLEEGLATFKALGQRPNEATAAESLANVIQELEGPRHARELLSRALRLYSDDRYVPGIVRVLITLAEAALKEGQATRSVQLLSGLYSDVEVHHPELDEALRTKLEKAVSGVRQRVDETVFVDSWAQGSLLSVDALLSFATQQGPAVEVEFASR